MRLRPHHLLAMLTTFCIAVMIVGSYLAFSPLQTGGQRSTEEDEMAEVIFRHAIGEHQESCDSIFLDLGERGDPTDDFMKRFENYSPRVKKGSQSGIYQMWGHTVVKAPDDSRCKLTLTFNQSDEPQDAEHRITLSTHTTSGHQSNYVYRLVRNDDEWSILDIKLGFIK